MLFIWVGKVTKNPIKPHWMSRNIFCCCLSAITLKNFSNGIVWHTRWKNILVCDKILFQICFYIWNCQKFCKFFTIVCNTWDAIHNKKTELLSLFVISLVLSLNFSINDTRSSGSFVKWNSALLLKHDSISASLCSSFYMPVTHSV